MDLDVKKQTKKRNIRVCVRMKIFLNSFIFNESSLSALKVNFFP